MAWAPGPESPGALAVSLREAGLLCPGLPVLVRIGLVLIHFVTILAPVAIVGAEVPAIRAEVAAVAIDVALIGANDLTGAAERVCDALHPSDAERPGDRLPRQMSKRCAID